MSVKRGQRPGHPRARLFAVLLCMLGFAAYLAWTRDAPVEPAAERTPAAVYWMRRARNAEERERQLAARTTLAEQSARAARRALTHRPSSVQAIRLAGITYQVPFSLLWSRATCESGPGPRARTPEPADQHVDARAVNTETGTGETAQGLFQFLGSTWRSTPYAALDPLDPYANALAAAWMQQHGRGREWTCTGGTR